MQYCRYGRAVLVALFLAIIVSACGGAEEPTQPTIRITTLENDSQVNTGQQVAVGFEAADVEGVMQVELTINGEPTYVEAADPPVNIFSGSYSWVPEQPGSYLIQVVTFNVNGEASDPAQVAVKVEGDPVAAVGEPTPTIAPVETGVGEVPTETPTVSFVPPTPAGGETPTPTTVSDAEAAVVETEDTPAAESTGPLVTANIGLNVRGGPGTNYPTIGRLIEGETAEITGRDQNGGWWQIAYSSESGDRGWVAADTEFTTAANADSVAVVEAPLPPDDAAAADDPAPDAPVDPALPVIFSFTTERDAIPAGESTILTWELENAKEAYLRYDGQEEGVVSPGSKSVSPGKDTTYTLVARNDSGETMADLTIRVTTPSPTSAPVRRDGRITLLSGQAVDFDDGVVQDDSGSIIDLAWDFQQRGFSRRNGAIGVLMSESFNDLTVTDCVDAPYGAPISGVDISGSVVGCYRTSEDRLGKFSIVDWDLTGKVTLDWLTWEK